MSAENLSEGDDLPERTRLELIDEVRTTWQFYRAVVRRPTPR
jgi:hypothetical protein